jgi:drug/metabolite transporter (DMT)-like permease
MYWIVTVRGPSLTGMHSHRPVAYACLLLAAALWGSNPVVARLIGDAIPPMTLSWCRWLLAACLLTPAVWAERRQIARALRRDWRVLLPLSWLATVPQSALIYKGLETTTAVNVGLLNSTVPVLIVLAGWLCFARSMLSREIGGIAVSFMGVAVMLFQGSLDRALSLSLNLGDLFAFGGMLTWAFYSLMLKRPPQLSLPAFVASLALCGIVSTFPIMMAEVLLDRAPRFDLISLAALAYIALGPTLCGMLAYSHGVERVGALQAGLFVHFMPVFASLFAVLLLGEQLHLYHLAGFALIAGGALIAVAFHRLLSSPPVRFPSTDKQS